jgi:hypothetical protein
VKIRTEIHDCIRNNDFERLKALLSKHRINLNSFNLSIENDTFLHSAAKSNNVKMIQFILQRLSPNIRQQLTMMKNNQQQLPGDLLTVWAPNTFTVSSEVQTWSKEARWNSLLSSNSLLQTTQRCSLSYSAICYVTMN